MSKNHMAEIAKLLGVEAGEVFRIEDSDFGLYGYYRIAEDGLSYSYRSEPYEWRPSPYFQSLIRGDIELTKLPQKPAIKDLYYYPDTTVPDLCGDCVWEDDEVDNYRFQHGFVFATREEAIEIAKQMQAVAKGDKENG